MPLKNARGLAPQRLTQEILAEPVGPAQATSVKLLGGNIDQMAQLLRVPLNRPRLQRRVKRRIVEAAKDQRDARQIPDFGVRPCLPEEAQGLEQIAGHRVNLVFRHLAIRTDLRATRQLKGANERWPAGRRDLNAAAENRRRSRRALTLFLVIYV